MQTAAKPCILSSSSEMAVNRRHIRDVFSNPASGDIDDKAFLAERYQALQDQDIQGCSVDAVDDDLHMLIAGLRLDLDQGKDIPALLVPVVCLSNAGIKSENEFESPIRKISSIAIRIDTATVPPPKIFHRSKCPVRHPFSSQP